MKPEERSRLVEVNVRHLPNAWLFRYWITATHGYFHVEGGHRAITRKRAERKAERYARWLARDAEPFHGSTRWIVTWPQRDLTDLREATQ